MCWRTTYTDNFGCGCIDVKVRPGDCEDRGCRHSAAHPRGHDCNKYNCGGYWYEHEKTLEFPEGCAPCITKRLIAEEAEENARNGGR